MKYFKIAKFCAVITFNMALVSTFWVFADTDFPLHGRVSYDGESTLIRGMDDEDWSRATLNTLVLTGDTLWVDKGGSTEIEFPEGVFFRMADASKAKIVKISPELSIYGITGSFYVERVLRSSGTVRFTTPSCNITFDPDTCVRIDIGESGTTRVSTRWGKVYVTTERGGNEVVSSGKQCWVDVGYLPSEVVSFATTEMDSFDRWNQGRSELLSAPVKTPPKYVEVTNRTIGYTELSRYGDWVLIDERYYWRPTVVINYVPYRTGYWTYVSPIGSVWVETYPFGYITTHYGRWVYYDSYGWVWGYDPVWSPAWVATVRCGDYFIWTPVDFYCRPVRVSTGVSFAVGGLNFYVGACSYVPATYVYTSPYYIAPVAPTVVNYIINNPTNVYVWNIERYPSQRIRIPYQNSMPMVRDYNPPRTIRGIANYNNSGILARARVEELESYFTRRTSTQGFRSQTGMPSSAMRTAMLNERSSSFREVRLNTTSPEATATRFAPEVLSQRGSSTDRSSIRGKEIDTGFTRAIERNTQIQSVRENIGSPVRSADVRNTLRSESSPTRVLNPPAVNRGIRNAFSEIPNQSEGVSRKGIESPSFSRLDMNGERKPREYDPSGGGSTTSPTRTTPRNDSGSGTTNRDRDNTTPRSIPTDRNNPGSRGNTRGSGLNWDNMKQTPTDIGTYGSVRNQHETPQRTSVPEFQIRSTDGNRGAGTFSRGTLREANVNIFPERTSISGNSGISVRTLPPQKDMSFSVPDVPRGNTSFGISRNTNKNSISSFPSFNRNSLSTRSFSVTPPSSSATTMSSPPIERNSAPSSFSVPKVNTPSFATPSTPSFQRQSPGFSNGRSSLGGRGIR
ncbi:MAG: DUF6600 domain-containing protein [Candidatus Hydrogenedens sp.]